VAPGSSWRRGVVEVELQRMAKRLPHNWTEIRRDWPALSVYQRFETFVALVLTLLVAAVILVALWRLIASVVDTLVLRSLNPLEHGIFQAVFGDILTVLIALEFNAAALAAEAALLLALGVTYWLMRERDDRLPGSPPTGPGGGAPPGAA
jgi:uncharacterized membrane protein (DUF373 family)